MHSASIHAKPEGSVGIFTASTGQQLFVTSAEGIGAHTVPSLLLRGKPFEDLGNIGGLNNRPLVMITQDGGTDYSSQNHNNEATPSRGGASVDYGMENLQVRDVSITGELNGTAEENSINNVTNATAVPTSGLSMNATTSEGFNRTAEAQNVNNSEAVPAMSLAFYQPQMMLNHQMFLQQQQTVNALIGKVDGLARMVGNNEQTRTVDEGNTRVKQLPRKRKFHTLSDSNVEDISSESENSEGESDGYNSDASECERNNEGRNTDATKAVTENMGELQISDNMRLLQDLSKELEKAEAVGEKVDETLSKVVDTGIRAQIDRNLAKELCGKYQRPENCNGLTVPKVNKELWNTTSLAKSSKDRDKTYQTAQKYLNQGLIPLVQLIDNLLKGKETESNFRLARDSFQLLAYAHRDLSNLRRQRLKAVVAEKYRPLCNDSTPLTENLLGDDLEKQIKTLDEMRKVGKDLTKKKGGEKRKYKSQDSYERASKYSKYSHNGNSGGYSNYKSRDKLSFLDRKSRYFKPDHHKNNKKNNKK